MANDFFQFKQFTIYQDQCAMKVTTDACLFGAVVAQFLKDKSIHSALDIGAGTGLLSLMLAQETGANIIGVELEAGAAKQARENCANSKWASNIRIIENSIQTYSKETNQQFDAIICNPPFFLNQLNSVDALRNKAMHETDLSLSVLFESVKKLLSSQGFFAVLLPFLRASEASKLADEKNLNPVRRIDVRQTPKHDFFRTILIFSSEDRPFFHETVTIKEGDTYTKPFQKLLAPYYLYL